MKTIAKALFLSLLPLAVGPCGGAGAQEKYREAVEIVATNSLPIIAGDASARLPFFSNRNLHARNADVDRAIIVIHGRLRNAGTYFLSTIAALEAAGSERQHTIIVAPQFLAGVDIQDRAHAGNLLHWQLDAWQSGEDAEGPAAVSSFEAMDALVARLADRSLFPALRTIVFVGHSAGGQVVQRYAILGRSEEALRGASAHLRYVVANASSYAYFNAERPDAEGRPAQFAAASCPAFDRWKFGMEDLPRYAHGADPGAAEEAYARRDVVYMLGALDTDPNHRALDKSCMAEAQGENRLRRGENYFTYLKGRHPQGLTHRVVHVPGVGHNGDRMLTSECGMAVLFDMPGCGAS